MANFVAFYCSQGDLFIDGVYLFNLNNSKENNLNLKELMRKNLGENFFNETLSFFSFKKMLLIFDNFDQKGILKWKFNSHIFSSLNENRISYLLISKNAILKTENNIFIIEKNYEVEPLGEEGSKTLLEILYCQNAKKYIIPSLENTNVKKKTNPRIF